MSNLKERLADMSALSQSRTPADALKYIEELEAKLVEYKMVAGAIDKQWAESEDEIAELQAKLAKAMGHFKKLRRRQDSLETFDAVVDEIVETAIGELEGEK